jgi:hypothetical protein
MSDFNKYYDLPKCLVYSNLLLIYSLIEIIYIKTR